MAFEQKPYAYGFDQNPPRSEWEHLIPFGYAPGGYMNRCMDCREEFIGEKRASRCKKCANDAFQAYLAAPKETTGELWEILVPCQWNDGQPVRTRHHKEWDKKVLAITGGLTVLRPAKGQWRNDDGLYTDRVIPVRIMATHEQMLEIVSITIAHYEQLAVMFYRVTPDCSIVEATEDQKAKFVRENPKKSS